MKILAFAASNSRQSINGKLVRYALRRVEALVPNAETKVLDLNDYEMPIYSIDRETEDGIPAKAQRFYDELGAVDAILISFAEHNGAYTAAYKNIFDWVSRIDMKVFQGKPVLAFSTSPGPRGGATVIGTFTNAAATFGAELIGSLSIGSFGERFDSESGLPKDSDLAQQIEDNLAALSGK